MSKFEYPRLSRSDIVTVLVQSQIAAVSERDFLSPNTEFLSDLYTRLLLCLEILNEEDQGQVEFAALEQLENPDFLMDSIRLAKLSNKVKQLVESVECPKKFTLKDLLRPDPDRTEIFLSAILNLYLYKDAKINLHVSTMDEINSFADQQREYEAKTYQLNAEIENYNQATERELPLVQEVDAKVKELRQTIAGLNNHQVSLRASIRKLKEKAGDMDEKVSNAEFLLVRSVQENANLRSKIVQSPDKLQRTLEEKKLARYEASTLERSAMQSFQDKTTIVEVYAEVSKKLSKLFARMQFIQEQVNSTKSVDKEFKILKAKVSDEEVLIKSLEAKMVEQQVKVNQVDELIKQLEKERDIKSEEATEELDNVKLEVESKRQDLQATQRNVEVVLMEVDAISLKTQSVRDSTHAKLLELTNKHEEIVREFNQYSNSIWSLLPTES